MNKKTLLSPQGLAQLEAYAPLERNLATLLSPEYWEDALAYWVASVPVEELIDSVLPPILSLTDKEDRTAQQCAQDIRAWLKDRDDERRRSLFAQAETLGFATPLGAIALALFLMGGSMTPADCEPVLADEHLAPLMLHTAVRLLSILLAGDRPPVAGAKQLLSCRYSLREA